MKMSTNKIAVVTGALKGLGLQTAIELAGKNLHVIITGRDASRGSKVQAQLKESGIDVEFMPLDVSDVQSIERFTAEVLKKYGHVDVLVNNAGIMIDNDEPTKTLDDFSNMIETTFRTNALGAFLLCQAFVPQMIGKGYGRVVNVSSGMGQLSRMGSGYPAYRISKAAMNAVTRIFSEESRGSNVLVNSVCPGWVRTDMGGPNADRSLEEGADSIVWLATLPNGSPSGHFFRDRKIIDW
ncbi:MAG: SDR family oxidoreductase [Leptospirales bacterium]